MPRGEDRGFALVVTVSMLVLLVLLAVSMLSLSFQQASKFVGNVGMTRSPTGHKSHEIVTS